MFLKALVQLGIPIHLIGGTPESIPDRCHTWRQGNHSWQWGKPLGGEVHVAVRKSHLAARERQPGVGKALLEERVVLSLAKG